MIQVLVVEDSRITRGRHREPDCQNQKDMSCTPP